MRKILSFIILIPLSIFSQNAKEIAKKCMSSTVSIIMQDKFNQPICLGSGFIVENGRVITNLHVIEGAASGYILVNGSNEKYTIDGYLSIDKINDLALLSASTLVGNKVQINLLKTEIGEVIYSIGNPKGLSGTISEGIISGFRNLENKELIQITAPISPGSSGGPVINNSGEIIGVAVGTLTSGQNLNFAIPVKFVENLLKSTNTSVTKLGIPKKPILTNTKSYDKNVREGVEIMNVEWEDNYLEGFSIRNNLNSEIKNIQITYILKNSQGIPIDYDEKNYVYYADTIKPNLSLYIHINADVFSQRVYKRKLGEKLEIRILDFNIVK